MFCPSCGKAIPENSSFCPLCGAALKSHGVEEAVSVGRPQAIPSTPGRAEGNDLGMLAERYSDVATAEDLAAFLESRLRLLDTFYWLPFVSVTALIMIVSLIYNSNTFWLVYPGSGRVPPATCSVPSSRLSSSGCCIARSLSSVDSPRTSGN